MKFSRFFKFLKIYNRPGALIQIELTDMLVFGYSVLDGLLVFDEYMILQNQNIHLCCHKASIGILGSVNNGFTSHIETCIYNNSRTCLLIEFFDEAVVAVISTV